MAGWAGAPGMMQAKQPHSAMHSLALCSLPTFCHVCLQALTKRPESRPSAAQLFQHRWVQQHYQQLLAAQAQAQPAAATTSAAAAAAIAAAAASSAGGAAGAPPRSPPSLILSLQFLCWRSFFPPSCVCPLGLLLLFATNVCNVSSCFESGRSSAATNWSRSRPAPPHLPQFAANCSSCAS